jgi:hypothetical protein
MWASTVIRRVKDGLARPHLYCQTRVGWFSAVSAYARYLLWLKGIGRKPLVTTDANRLDTVAQPRLPVGKRRLNAARLRARRYTTPGHLCAILCSCPTQRSHNCGDL